MRALAICFSFLTALSGAENDALPRAVESFQNAKTDPRLYRDAASLFAQCELSALTAENRAAWAYCRLRFAAEEWNRSKGDLEVGRRMVAEAADALALVPDHAELQKFGRSIIVAAGGKPPEIVKPITAETGWFSLETVSFRVRFHSSAKAAAEALVAKVEEQRTTIFTRWSGPPQSAWSVKCEIVLHADAAEFAKATGLSKDATGHALVTLKDGQPSLRRIDLRADDAAAEIDALPRELTHVILADLFPATPPPRWAEDGMAILAMSPDTVNRYLATATKLGGKLPGLADLHEGKSADVTATLVASTAAVDHLARAKGERSFTIFVRDSRRYGLEKAVERQYGHATLNDADNAIRTTLKQVK